MPAGADYAARNPGGASGGRGARTAGAAGAAHAGGTNPAAERAYRAGVPRVYRPEVAIQIHKAALAKRARAKRGKPKFDPSGASTERALRTRAKVPRIGRTPESAQEDLARRIRAAYVAGAAGPSVDKIFSVPGVGAAERIGGSGAFKKYAAGGNWALTGAGIVLDRLARLGAPVGEGLDNLDQGPGGVVRGIGTGLKRTVDNEPYKLASGSIPKSGNAWVDAPLGFVADVVTNPASFVTVPVSGTRTAIANSIRQAGRFRYLGRAEVPGGASLGGRYVPPVDREIVLFNPKAGPDLPLGRLASTRRVGRELRESPYPLGVSNRPAYQPSADQAARRRPGMGIESNLPAVRGRRTDLGNALRQPYDPNRKPGVNSLNRLRQRDKAMGALYGQVAGKGVRLPSLAGAKRTGRQIGRKEVGQRIASQVAARRVNRANKPIKVNPRETDPVGTQVPGLVGTSSRTERYRVAFRNRPSSPTPGAVLPGGATRAGARPKLRATPPESYVPVKGSYKGEPVTQVERYQVIPVKGGFKIRDTSQRKTYTRVFKTEREAIGHSQNLASRRSGNNRARDLTSRTRIPNRVKPRDVPHTNLPRLIKERDEALARFRKAMSKRTERGDIPDNTVRRAGRLMAQTVMVENDLLRIQKKLTLLRKTREDLAEKGKLLRRKRQLELELDSTMEKLAKQIGKTQGAEKDELIAAYEAHRAARDALNAATAEITARTGAGRAALRAAVARKPPKATRTPTEGQKRLLEPPGPAPEPPARSVPRQIDRIEATALQVLRAPYPLKATVQVNKLRAQIAKLEADFARMSGGVSTKSVSTLARTGQKYQKLQQRILEAENNYFYDRRTWELAKPTFDQKKKFQASFRFSEMENMANDIMKIEMEVEGALAKFAEEPGRMFYLPGLGVPVRLPALTASTAKLLKNKEPQLYQMLHDLKELGRDLFVTQYGPNRAVGAAARSVDSAVQSANGHSFDAIREIVRNAKVPKADLKKITHWLETKEFDDELSDEAKALGMALQKFIEKRTDEYIQAGGDLKRLGRSYVFHMVNPKEWDKSAFDSLMKEPDVFVFGNTPAFTRERPDPSATIRALLDKGFDMEENIAVLTFMRVAAHNRAMGDLAISNAVSRNFASKIRRKADDAFLETDSIDPKSVKRVLSRDRMLADMGDTVMGRGSNIVVNDVVRDTFKLEKGLYLPEDVARTLLKLQYIRQANAKSVFKTLRQLNSKWKQWALLTTGYDIRNQIGDMILGAQAGTSPVRSIIRGIFWIRGRDKVARTGPEFVTDVARRAVGLPKIQRRGPTYKQLKQEAQTLGVAQRGVLPQDVESHLSGAAAIAGRKVGGNIKPDAARFRGSKFGLRRLRVGRENINRGGAYTHQVVAKKKAPYAASRTVNEALFDYGDVGSLVQQLRTSPLGMPFITWLAKNIPAQAKRAPSRTNVELTALNNQLAQASADPNLGQPSFGNQPEYLMERLALPVPGLNRFAHFGLPQSDLNRLLPTTPGQTLGNPLEALGAIGQQWGPDLGPIPQAALGLITNRNPLTGQDMRPGDKVPASGIDQFIRRISGQPDEYKRVRDDEGGYTAVPATGALQKWLLDQAFPPLANLSRINKNDIPNVSEDRVGSGNLGFDPWQLLATMGGISTKPFWNERDTTGAVVSAKFEFDDAKGALRKQAQEIELGTGQPVKLEQDAEGFITDYAPANMKQYVVNYNRRLMRLLEASRILEGINRG